MKHTPTPWHVGIRPGPMIYGIDGEQVADMHYPLIASDENKANAAHIVKCVNAHDDLVAALSGLIATIEEQEPVNKTFRGLGKARAILAKVQA